jgi:hypothetical protein
MTQTSYALLTNTGRAKEAAALGGGDQVVITHIAIGDGATVPSGGETSLYNETARKTISGQGVVSGASNVAYSDIFLAAAEGPYTIREAGMIDSDGDLIAIAKFNPPINKPTPDSGSTVEATIRMEVAFSDLAVVTITVDPSMAVALQRLSVLPWIPVLSVTTTAPPELPAIGDTYVIPAGATGSWSGHAQKVAEYTTAGWAIITPKDGHGVGLPDGRIFTRRSGTYVEQVATDTFKGQVELATTAEVKTGTDTTRAVTPASLVGNYSRIIDTEITKTVGSGGDFADLIEAFAWLSYYRIAASGVVNFEMSSHNYDGVTAELDHPDSTRIFITGSDLDGAVPTYSDLTITGSGPSDRASDNATNIAFLRTRFTTELTFENGAWLYLNCELGGFEKVLITVDGSVVDGLYSAATQNLSVVAVYGAGFRGIVETVGLMNLDRCMAIGCTHAGFIASNGGTISCINEMISVSNGTYGGLAEDSGVIRYQSGPATFAGNGTQGLTAQTGGKVLCNTTWRSISNGGHGFFVTDGGFMDAQLTQATNNAGWGWVADFGGVMKAQTTGGSGNAAGDYAADTGGIVVRTGGSTLATPAVGTSNANGGRVV